MLEFFKILGAVVGLVGGGFALWDRLLRHAPSISMTAKPISQWGEPQPYLRVKNQAPHDILIEEIDSNNESFSVSAGHSTDAILDGLIIGKTPVLLAPAEERLLPIVRRPKMAASERVTFTVYWRKTEFPWLQPPSIRIRTSAADLELRVRSAKIVQDEERDALKRQ
jgi:hypothetical protein